MSDREPWFPTLETDPLCSYCGISLSEHEEITPLCEEVEDGVVPWWAHRPKSANSHSDPG